MLDRSFIRQSAAAAGFDLCGVAPCRHLVRNEQFFRRWLGDGRHASLGYLERNLDIGSTCDGWSKGRRR